MLNMAPMAALPSAMGQQEAHLAPPRALSKGQSDTLDDD